VVSAGAVHEVVDVVQAAVRDGLTVRPVGSGHSFTGLASTDGVLLDVSRLCRIRSVDPQSGLVEVEAGITVHELTALLWPHGLALQNQGDIDKQTLAGAISTGTHGTGSGFASLSSRVRAMELVLADGEVVRCSPSERADLFWAAQVGLGAFGVLTAVTVECVPAFTLAASEVPTTWAELRGSGSAGGPGAGSGSGSGSPGGTRLDELVATNDHVELFWFPHTDRVLSLTLTRGPGEAAVTPEPRWKAWWEEAFMANRVLGAVLGLGAAVPRLVPGLNRAVSSVLSTRRYSDRGYRVYSHERDVVFRESEWSFPRDALLPVVDELTAWFAREGRHIAFPLEVRFGAAEDAWLSPSFGRDSCYVAAHSFHRVPHGPYFAAWQQIALAHGGRPHWGKMHTLDAEQLTKLYPRFADAARVRDEVDPNRVFANPHLTQVFGS
jgi:L-gulono-1,4-lactone dehydrogenase